ncbi:hypothetical protein MNB_SV-15-1338 [hydrothermal vent metagenome]|uniref:Septum formation initiator n=1 Tax=hydrothermal vent metagenome TaxID=652676 RepID=A0A1W1EI06_9ZZZZ
MIKKAIRRVEYKAGISIKYIVLSFVIVILFGVYIANVLFGTNSIYTLVDLNKRKDLLQQDVYKLKNKNKLLQKSYFELKQIEIKNR